MSESSIHRVQVFHQDGFLDRDPSGWGWQCFTCHTETTGLATLAAAETSADMHGKRI